MNRMIIGFVGLLYLVILVLTGFAAEGTISGPYNHDNIQVFLVHGDARLEHKYYATLGEAMDRGIVDVAETGNVQELHIENVSKDTTVFVHSGDIVKGGKQDRTIRYDLVLPPRSGKVPLASFCVESGRWRQRGNESAGKFGKNDQLLSSRGLRIAAKRMENQSAVWQNVAEHQKKLSDNVGDLAGRRVDVQSSQSASSLQLSLENKDLNNVMNQYMRKLEPILSGQRDVVGFVYAINGEINNAEVYGNKKLFRSLWPKLLRAAVTEAIAERRKGRPPARITADDLPPFFRMAVSGSIEEDRIWKTTLLRTYSTSSTLLFETVDVDAGHLWIHKNFIQKGDDPVVVPLGQQMDYQQRSTGRRGRQ